MGQANQRWPGGRPPADEVPLLPTPADGQASQWPGFALTPAQRAAIRASGTARGDQAPWLLTTRLAPPTAAEVMLPAGPVPPPAPDATGTLTGAPRAATVAATASSRSIRMSGPQPGPLGGAAGATPTGRLVAARPGPPSGVRVASAQQAPQRAVGPPPAQRGPVAGGAPRGPAVGAGNVPANRPPVWSPMPGGQGLAPSAPDALGQRLALTSVTLSVVAVLICWLAVLAPPLGLFPVALAVAGVIVGHVARRRMSRGGAERRLALTGVTLGYLGAIASVGFLLFVVSHGGG